MRLPVAQAGWADQTFNPWLDDRETARAGIAPAWRQNAQRCVGLDAEALSWNAEADGFKASHEGRRRRVFAGPWCTVIGGTPKANSRAQFWSLVQRTKAIDWLVLADDGFADDKSLPEDWRKGYENVWVGASITSMATAGAILACLRRVPAKLRFVLASPTIQDLGDLDLRGVGWVIVSIGAGEEIADPDAVASVKLQANYQGVPVWFDRQGWNGGSSLSSGGVFEVQESPRTGW